MAMRFNNSGVGMIEVLVTLVILSIGLLGLAALQLTGLRSNSSAGARSAATMLANDMADRMRANPKAVNNNDFANIDTATINCNTLPNPYCSDYYDGTHNVAAQPCTVDQLAAFDINVWYCGVEIGNTRGGGFDGNKLLPNGHATVICNDNNTADADACTDGSTHTITVSWLDRNPQQANATASTMQSISLRVTP